MTSPVRAMLENLYEAFYEKFQDSTLAWDKMLAFVACYHYSPLIHQLTDELEWVAEDSELIEKVKQAFDPKVLHYDKSDTLGEMYVDNFVSRSQAGKQGIALTPPATAGLMAAMTVPETDNRVFVLDPSVGTGRLLLAAWERAPNGLFFGVDSDLRMLRIAYTNLKIHNIHSHVLHANFLVHATDLETEAGRHNWKYSNQWYSQMDKLLPIDALRN